MGRQIWASVAAAKKKKEEETEDDTNVIANIIKITLIYFDVNQNYNSPNRRYRIHLRWLFGNDIKYIFESE